MSLILPSIRAVVFDAVGTLIIPDPAAPEVYRTIAVKQGVELEVRTVRDRFRAAYRTEEEADRANGWRTSEARERERWRTIVTSALQGLPDPDAGFLELYEHFAQSTSWRLNDGVESVLTELAGRGLILGMGTNYDSRVSRVIAGLPELAHVADRVTISAAVGFRKPAREFFQEVIRSVGCSANQILFVGDDEENDFAGARAAGLHSVLLDPKCDAPAVDRIASLRELSA